MTKEKIEYDFLPENIFGKKYIIRSKCCIGKVYTAKLICGDCEKMPCEPLKFIEETRTKTV